MAVAAKASRYPIRHRPQIESTFSCGVIIHYDDFFSKFDYVAIVPSISPSDERPQDRRYTSEALVNENISPWTQADFFKGTSKKPIND
ncbi:hypothetical protein N7492_003998 [Penicillium capsulatum]|uniref:Uncharacterized protein n=1 Tax=Penicillium capsulatum TaxID=69766 RepID=A0A9W9LWS1_9EURO|nr:hypothetical protein N7492_003998 [Penicillium capsulatum]